MYNNEERKKPDQLTITFIIVQLIIVLVMIFLIPTLFQSNQIKSDDLARQPKITINGLDNITPKLPNKSVDSIQRKLLQSIQANIDDVNTSDAVAIIRSDSLKTIEHFSKSGLNYLSAIIDIPKLEQSYRLFYEYDSETKNWTPSPHELFLITCLNQQDQILYLDFVCHDSYGTEIYNGVVSRYIDRLSNENFSLFMGDSLSILYINPFDEGFETKKQEYNEQAKTTIESLGIPSGIFTYQFPDYSNLSYDLYESN